MVSRVEACLRDRFPERSRLAVRDWQLLSTGWESTVHAFVQDYVEDGCHRREDLVVRVYEGLESPLLPGRFEREYPVMKRLAAGRYPVPTPHLFVDDPSVLGAPFMVMDRIQGRTADEVYSQAAPAEREQLLAAYCRLLADLHRLDPATYSADLGLDVPVASVAHQLSTVRALAGQTLQDEFGPVIEWLDRSSRGIGPVSMCLLHGDFHSSNVLVDGTGKMHVVDWTLATISDYRFDLANALLFLDRENQRRRFVDEYRQLSGSNADHLDFFGAFVCCRRLALLGIILSGNGRLVGVRPGMGERLAGRLDRHIELVRRHLTQLTGLRAPDPTGR